MKVRVRHKQTLKTDQDFADYLVERALNLARLTGELNERGASVRVELPTAQELVDIGDDWWKHL